MTSSSTTTPTKRNISSISIIAVTLTIAYISTTFVPYHLRFSSSSSTTTFTPLSHRTVLITGATGRTGSIVYSLLSSDPSTTVRALVRDVDKAREVLKCTTCDEHEGIYTGDVTNPDDLVHAASGVDTVVVLASSGPGLTPEEQRAVEFDGVVSTVNALAQETNRVDGTDHLRVVLCSSMGTTQKGGPGGHGIGDILFWKLNAEAFLASSGIGSTIVKPCGLTQGVGENATLVVGHHDVVLDSEFHSLPREDVARVMVEAVLEGEKGLRFDLCSRPGPGTVDLEGLLEEARWEWEK